MSRVFCIGLTLAVAVLVCGSARGEFPDKFTNLKVLPKEISKQELQATMRGFAFALGVRCEHCHVEKKAGGGDYDFPADDKQAKKTARVMLQMVDRINRDYIGKLAQRDASPLIHVECMTCHHGLTRPQPLNAVLAASLDKDGPDKTIALYQQLRARYYGTGQYDFGETPLNLLAEALLGKERNADALAVMNLSFSMNHPDSVWSYHMFAFAHQANGQLDLALADYRKALELHPDDSWAQQQIEALAKPKSDR
jgi:tetratricopeptide (TPR) repeat protein